MFGCDALVEIAHHFGELGRVKLFYSYLVKDVANQRVNFSVEVTSICHDFLDGGNSVLPGLNSALVTEPMFNKEKSATGF